jgi:endonuclease/exonuclease/phosphatase family metal-dependent hydrolase
MILKTARSDLTPFRLLIPSSCGKGFPMFHQKLRLVALVLLIPLAGLAVVLPGCNVGTETGPQAEGYLLCFWNVENLFDDVDDGRHSAGDRDYDSWFAHHPEILELKLSHLSEALVKLNNGRGPDILAVAEVESPRAAELLRQALNKRLTDEALHYKDVLMKDKSAGRHISPAIITRLPVVRNKTRQHGKRLRILEGHIVVNAHELVVIASHWTKYGDQIYGVFKGMYLRNPKVDFLVCGDFNDNPDDDSVTQHLRALGDREAVLHSAGDPRLFNLFAGKDPAAGFGTHYDRGRWYLFDQIAVSAGLLDDSGWNCDPASTQIVNTLVRPRDRKGRPWRFGNQRDLHERGYSDHFPVTVRLKVNEP